MGGEGKTAVNLGEGGSYLGKVNFFTNVYIYSDRLIFLLTGIAYWKDYESPVTEGLLSQIP